MNSWSKIVNLLKLNYDSLIDWDDRYFYCPKYHEPIYEDEWADFNFIDDNNNFICPICGDAVFLLT